jgi:mannosidase alpha-like ER degradation enhancer 1
MPQLPAAMPDVTDAAETITSEFMVEACTGDFGVDVGAIRKAPSLPTPSHSTFGFSGAHLVRFPDNPFGCLPYNDPSGRIVDAMVYIARGECLFVEKLVHARNAGALGVVVWHDSEERLNPSSETDDLVTYGRDFQEGTILVIPASAASFVQTRLLLEETDPENHMVMVSLVKDWPEQFLGEDPTLRTAPTKTTAAPGRILFINGHAMINTELLF